EGEHLRLARTPDVVECLFAADLLISDASSVVNEYALLDRPIVFLDVPELLAAARDREGSALDLDTWGRRGGEVVAEPAEVVVADLVPGNGDPVPWLGAAFLAIVLVQGLAELVQRV